MYDEIIFKNIVPIHQIEKPINLLIDEGFLLLTTSLKARLSCSLIIMTDGITLRAAASTSLLKAPLRKNSVADHIKPEAPIAMTASLTPTVCENMAKNIRNIQDPILPICGPIELIIGIVDNIFLFDLFSGVKGRDSVHFSIK